MVKFSKDNKIKNQNIQNLQIIKTKQKKKSLLRDNFSKDGKLF